MSLMIAANGLTRCFGDRPVVEDLTFDVRRGEIVALVGPNGAGKTTTLRMLAGLIAPTRGGIVVDGVPLTPARAGEVRARTGFLTETPGLWDRLTVRENLQVYARLHAIRAPARAVDRVLGVLELADRARTRAAELSRGMRQKLALARALVHDPPVLLLDEPTSGLDPEIARSVRRLLEERRAAGRAILVSTHNLDEVERLADRVAVLRRRLLALDRPENLRRLLATGRVVVRLNGAADAFLDAARAVSPEATAERAVLTAPLAAPERDAPELVRALVAAGAEIVEVRPETADLETVYLRLVGAGGGTR